MWLNMTISDFIPVYTAFATNLLRIPDKPLNAAAGI